MAFLILIIVYIDRKQGACGPFDIDTKGVAYSKSDGDCGVSWRLFLKNLAIFCVLSNYDLTCYCFAHFFGLIYLSLLF